MKLHNKEFIFLELRQKKKKVRKVRIKDFLYD